MSKVTLTIDGREITVSGEATILEAAAELGIRIPTLCWLEKVSTTGACRVCVVEIEGIDRTMTACNTRVKEGIKVTTSSPRLQEIRKKTLELMLVNHPLDCPVCDAAGECDLQDACYSLKVDHNRYRAHAERLPIRHDWKLLESDPNRCILCEKCVKVCREIVGREAIEVVNRGDRTIIDTVSGDPLNCDFCGNCINACPTGTLISKPFKFRGRPWSFNVTPGVCSFCSSGCEIDYHVRDGIVERVTSSDSSYNKGTLCVNGRFGYSAFNSSGRLDAPLLKGSDGSQRTTSWDDALKTATDRLGGIKDAFGGEAIAGIGSPRCTNEDNYLFQKFLRSALGSNNIDSEARLGYLQSQEIQYDMLGYSGGTYPMNAIEQASAVIVAGSDLKGESAGFAYRVIQASLKNNAKVILLNSRKTSLNKYANSFLQALPGSEAWALLGLCKAIVSEGLERKEFIASFASNAEEFIQSLGKITFEQISAQCGIGEQELRAAAKLASNGSKTAVVYGNDIIRSSDLTAAVTAAVNLALLTGAAGENGAGIYPVDEKNNTQGMLDMGITPDYLPGFHPVATNAARFGDVWKASLSEKQGCNIHEILEGIEKGTVKALYVMGANPLAFMPDRKRVMAALSRLDLLIVQDLFLTETARLAHIVLPAASAAEKSGSFTSIDNRVQCFQQAAPPRANSLSDSEILSRLHSLCTGSSTILSSEALHHEITELSGLYSESCDHDGCRMGRIKNRVDYSSFKAKFRTVAPAAESCHGGMPFILLSAPVQHHNGSMTAWSDNNTLVAPECYLEVSPADASALNISNGDNVTVSNQTASITCKAMISDALLQKTVFMPSNFLNPGVNSILADNSRTAGVKLEKA